MFSAEVSLKVRLRGREGGSHEKGWGLWIPDGGNSMREGPRREGTCHIGKGPVYPGCGEHRRRAVPFPTFQAELTLCMCLYYSTLSPSTVILSSVSATWEEAPLAHWCHCHSQPTRDLTEEVLKDLGRVVGFLCSSLFSRL